MTFCHVSKAYEEVLVVHLYLMEGWAFGLGRASSHKMILCLLTVSEFTSTG